MNNSTYIKTVPLVLQLNHLLAEDDECLRMLRRLQERIHLLNIENLDTLGLEVAREIEQQGNSFAPSDVKQMVEALMGTLPLLKRANEQIIEQRAKVYDQIAEHDDYLLALEARNTELLEELKNSGADVSKFTPIPKP